MTALKTAMAALSLLVSSSAFAGTIISVKKNQTFGIFDGGRQVFCQAYDTDGDGKLDKTSVSVNLGNVIHKGAGVLQRRSIDQEFKLSDNSLCEKIERIVLTLPQTYSAMYGSFDSVLTLESDRLVEDLTITLRASAPHYNPETITLTTQTVKILN